MWLRLSGGKIRRGNRGFANRSQANRGRLLVILSSRQVRQGEKERPSPAAESVNLGRVSGKTGRSMSLESRVDEAWTRKFPLRWARLALSDGASSNHKWRGRVHVIWDSLEF